MSTLRVGLPDSEGFLMTIALPILKDRFEGCLLGLAVGDAFGGKFEAQTADAIRIAFPRSSTNCLPARRDLVHR